MASIVRIIGSALLTGVLGAGIGFVLFGQLPDSPLLILVFGCVGATVGSIAGAALEIVTALRQRSSG
jgi:hypothetical protein